MKKVFAYITLFAFVLSPAHAGAGTVRTVDWDGRGDYTTIQAAIDASTSGDEVRVAMGTYVERVTMKAGVGLFGGYSSVGWSRDVEKHVTVIFANNTGSAVTAAGAVLDGFTIKGSGPASGILAGVYVNACSPTISNNRIIENGRHGIYVEGNSTPSICNNVIKDNAYYGIYCYSFVAGRVAYIFNNTIAGNRRGIQLYAFSPSIKNNIITGSAEYGMADFFAAAPVVDYNDLWSNAGGDYYDVTQGDHDISTDPLFVGGGDYHLSTSPTLSPCIDSGVDVGLPANNIPDMGAYESDVTLLNPWPPEGLRATPGSAKVKLDWSPNREPDLAGYVIYYGNVSGSYTGSLDAGNVTEYEIRSLINDATYFFALKAYDTGSNSSGYSAEISATPTAGEHELPHYNWDESYRGGDCAGCHFRDTGSGELLPPGYDYRYSTELCLNCHNIIGQGKEKQVSLSNSHPVFMSATTGGNNLPTYGSITGRLSTRMGDHLKDGRLVVCNTCHNIMEKTEDPGRTWEMTTFSGEGAWMDYVLQNGGWYWYDYLIPEVYTSLTLTAAPTYIKDRRTMRISTDDYDFNPDTGRVVFNAPFFDYAYVTLSYPYLRVNNSDNVMCLDCHNIGTHQLINCLTCHENHNYANRHGIRAKVKTPDSGIKGVVFSRVTGAGSFADGGVVSDGICEVCHTQTKYYKNDGTGFASHSSGVNYDRQNCLTCHTHVSGFSKY